MDAHNSDYRLMCKDCDFYKPVCSAYGKCKLDNQGESISIVTPYGRCKTMGRVAQIMSYEALVALDNLDALVRRKLDMKKKDPFVSGKKLDGYEEAMLAVLSMIHSEKNRHK